MSSEFGERLEMAQDAFNDLLLERDTLITALRECVVALEMGAVYVEGEASEYQITDYSMAHAHANSILERYKGDK